VFEEFMGIPLHPLTVHAPVVFVPLLVVTVLAYALVPFLRPHLRLALAALAVIAPLSALVAKLAGDAFFKRLDSRGMSGGELQTKIEEHRSFGNMTVYATITLAVIALLLVYLVAPRRAAGAGGGGTLAAGKSPAVALVLTFVAVAGAAFALYYVVRTGDSGAKAVWTGF
jgi:glucan phosphoethanolaminetransferase (alkaline phosphatase superfamily)